MTDEGMKPLPRIFKFGKQILEDPGRNMTPEEVVRHYSRQYPSLTKGEISSPTLSKGEEVYKIEGSYGTKG